MENKVVNVLSKGRGVTAHGVCLLLLMVTAGRSDASPTDSGHSDTLKTLDKDLLRCYSLSLFPSKAIVVWHCLSYAMASDN